MRVAPAPLYNSYTDVWRFVNILEAALDNATNDKQGVATGDKN